MAAIVWDKTGEHFYETGVDHGVLYLYHDADTTNNITAGFGDGVAWNGLTAVNESPSGAEATPLYADNIKYLNLMSAEEYGCTIEAYTYPEEFEIVGERPVAVAHRVAVLAHDERAGLGGVFLRRGRRLTMFSKILIANRGVKSPLNEFPLRIRQRRTCRPDELWRMNLQSLFNDKLRKLRYRAHIPLEHCRL